MLNIVKIKQNQILECVHIIHRKSNKFREARRQAFLKSSHDVILGLSERLSYAKYVPRRDPGKETWVYADLRQH